MGKEKDGAEGKQRHGFMGSQDERNAYSASCLLCMW
jgi:hypothetical protein